MSSAIFLHSDVADPYTLYDSMRATGPAHFNNTDNMWALYSYEYCTTVLHHPHAHIPAINNAGLNEYALAISSRLVRLSNASQHLIYRQVVDALFAQMKPVHTASILQTIIPRWPMAGEIDWINTVCKRLPAACILAGFGITAADHKTMAAHISNLVKIMQPQKTPAQVESINIISEKIYRLLEKNITATHLLYDVEEKIGSIVPRDELLSICISNLAGLIIQCYDAGRGLLSNALFHCLQRYSFTAIASMNTQQLQQVITEIIRFYPPIHNTRRMAVEDITLPGASIKKGQSILVVLAAANRDPGKFETAGLFNIDRFNNNEHLSFGTGHHHCMANQLSINMAVETLQYLFEHYTGVTCVEDEVMYEPLANARLIKKLSVKLSSSLTYYLSLR
jgi:cytochrome P450